MFFFYPKKHFFFVFEVLVPVTGASVCGKHKSQNLISDQKMLSSKHLTRYVNFLFICYPCLLILSELSHRQCHRKKQKVSVCLGGKKDFTTPADWTMGHIPAWILMTLSAREIAPLHLLQCHPLKGTQGCGWKLEAPPEMLLFCSRSLGFATSMKEVLAAELASSPFKYIYYTKAICSKVDLRYSVDLTVTQFAQLY